jgi:hypothetical protein
MQATTWIDRITDESTLWLNAVRSEDQREFAQAATLYLNDAMASLAQGVPAWAALSCSCAANCLGEIGLPSYSKRLYLESARIYLERANTVATSSVREMVWALRQAQRQFIMADELEMAKEASRRITTISRRIDPFRADAPVPVPDRSDRRRGGAEADDESLRGSPVVAEVEKFLRARETGRYDAGKHTPAKGGAAPAPRRAHTNEKSVVNQLG